jgi:hypothetical protein
MRLLRTAECYRAHAVVGMPFLYRFSYPCPLAPTPVPSTLPWVPGNLANQAIQITRKEQPAKPERPAGGAGDALRGVDIQQALAEKMQEEALKAEYERKRQKARARARGWFIGSKWVGLGWVGLVVGVAGWGGGCGEGGRGKGTSGKR